MIKITWIFIALLVFSGCTTEKAKNEPISPISMDLTATSSAKTQEIKEKNTIEIKQSSFSPNTYTIRPNTTIKWINQENTPHIIRSQGNFLSPALKNGESFSFTFIAPGEYFFECAIQTYMKGRIIVEK